MLLDFLLFLTIRPWVIPSIFSFLCSLSGKLSHVLGNGLRHDSISLHVRAHLLWNLLEDLLSEVSSLHALVEFNELDDVTCGWDSTRVAEAATITIELLHGVELGVTHADNNDGAGHLGEITDQVDSLRHVVDGSVGQQ